MTKKISILYPEIFEEVKKHFASGDIEVSLLEKNQSFANFDFVVVYNEYDLAQNFDNIINVHPSLLPAYKSKNAIADAFNDGVKVSGITIHSKDKIIAQYPILISLETHADDFVQEVHQVASKLLPLVIDSLLEDKVFDFSDLFSNPCHKNGGCSGCGGCH